MNRKRKNFQWVTVVLYMLLGVCCGFLMGRYLRTMPIIGNGLEQRLLSLAVLLVGLSLAVGLQTFLHELGHLVFGLCTGYRFSSFRIGSLVLLKERGRLVLRRVTLAGTGGQCLMIPPDMNNGNFPAVLYNLGGSLMNMLSALVFLGVSLLCEGIPLLPAVLMMCAISGFVLAAVNGIPLSLGLVNNDGYNAWELRKNKAARRSLWVQMKANEMATKGVRMKDMPENWFALPDDSQMQNGLTSAMGVFACNRLMDEHRFQEADALMQRLLSMESGIVGLHRRMMICDRIYCELMDQNRTDVLESLYDKEQKKFMRSMKNFPSVLRTEYAYALLSEKDAAKAEAFRKQFEQCAKSYPYPSDIASERELMDLAESLSV